MRPPLEPLTVQLGRLWARIHHRRRFQLLGIVFLAFGCSLAEMVTLAVLYPFIAILSGEEIVNGLLSIYEVLSAVPAIGGLHPVVAIAAVLVASLSLAAVLRIASIWANARLTQFIGGELADDIFRRTVYQPYLIHVSRNSSEIITALTEKVSAVIMGIVSPILGLMQASVIAFFIIATLLAVNRVIAVTMMVFFGVLYGIVIAITRERLYVYGTRINELNNQRIKVIQEGLGGIRDVLIDASQEFYIRQFISINASLRSANANINIVSSSPPYLIVTLGMIAISLIAAYVTVRDQGASNVLPLLGVFALGAQRLLPLLQQGYSAWGSIRSNREALRDVLELMYQEMPLSWGMDVKPLPFSQKIELRNISFIYPGRSARVLADLSMLVVAGQKVGIFGITGGGKSTLIDVIMGLMPPSEGRLEVDGEPIDDATRPAWRRNIAHVPPAIS